MAFDLFTLSNGLRVVGERIPHFRSVAVGMWVGSGSQYECTQEAGISHFIEHMVFKGTAARSARQISEEMDAVGGQLNAFTGKECTCFYAKTVDSDLPLAADIVSELAAMPVFDPVELEKEKGVVLEEIAMSEDTPEDLVHDLLMQAHFGNQRVARPILGSEERIEAYTAEDLRRYWAEMYRPQNCVFSVAGSYDPDQLKSLLEHKLEKWQGNGGAFRGCKTKSTEPGICTKEKDIEQVHICLGFPGIPIGDKMGYEYTLFNSVYGGAMSSRLFQSIREEEGMAYTVYSCPNDYTDCGMLSVYAATNPETAQKVYRRILEETKKFVDGGMTHREFQMAKDQLRASFILGQESSSSRMQSNGRRLLLLGTTRTEDEVIDRIESIDYDRTNALARELLSKPHSLALVGRNAGKIAKRLSEV